MRNFVCLFVCFVFFFWGGGKQSAKVHYGQFENSELEVVFWSHDLLEMPWPLSLEIRSCYFNTDSNACNLVCSRSSFPQNL